MTLSFYETAIWLESPCSIGPACMCMCGSHSVMSNSLWPHGLYSLPGSSAHGILQARIDSHSCLEEWLKWVAIPSPENLPDSGIEPGILHSRQILYCLSHQGSPVLALNSVQFSSVTQSCLTLCNPMDCSTPGFPVHHQLLESTQTHVHQVSDAITTISSSVVPFSSCRQSLPASGSFPMSQFFASGGQSTGVLASASVLPMNTQDWSPLGWTGWISLQSKGLSRVFSNTIVQQHQFFSAQLSSQSSSHIHTWP